MIGGNCARKSTSIFLAKVDKIKLRATTKQKLTFNLFKKLWAVFMVFEQKLSVFTQHEMALPLWKKNQPEAEHFRGISSGSRENCMERHEEFCSREKVISGLLDYQFYLKFIWAPASSMRTILSKAEMSKIKSILAAFPKKILFSLHICVFSASEHSSWLIKLVSNFTLPLI